MPRIDEEDGQWLDTPDFSQLLDLPGTEFAGPNETAIGTDEPSNAYRPVCPSHPGGDEYVIATHIRKSSLLTWHCVIAAYATA